MGGNAGWREHRPEPCTKGRTIRRASDRMGDVVRE